MQRLSEMVETAVRLAQAAVRLPQQLKETESSAVGNLKTSEILGDAILEDPSEQIAKQSAKPTAGQTGQAAEKPPTVAAVAKATPAKSAKVEVASTAPVVPETVTPKTVAPAKTLSVEAPAPQALPSQVASEAVPAPTVESSKKKLFWSSALTPAGDASKAVEPDQSHVPPVLRGLSKCEGPCGFPISAGRNLCVECEEEEVARSS